MNELLTWGLAFAAGMGLGAAFFGSLWFVVRKGISSQRPALWFFGSLLFRTGIIVAGFYVVANGHFQRLLPCLLGFLIARTVMTRRLKPVEPKNRFTAGTRHAP
jgi:F1F0 ATPase subunit 2